MSAAILTRDLIITHTRALKLPGMARVFQSLAQSGARCALAARGAERQPPQPWVSLRAAYWSTFRTAPPVEGAGAVAEVRVFSPITTRIIGPTLR